MPCQQSGIHYAVCTIKELARKGGHMLNPAQATHGGVRAMCQLFQEYT